MRLLIGWSAVIAVAWLVAMIAVHLFTAVAPPDQRATIDGLRDVLLTWGQAVGSFVAPALQLALILWVLIAAAEKLGWLERLREVVAGVPVSPTAIASAANIQAVVAIVIVVAVAVAALAGVGRVDVLKDLALVVVGFYFGTRRRPGEPETVAAPTTTPPGSSQTKAGYEDRNPFE